jgi:hypothetical protein
MRKVRSRHSKGYPVAFTRPSIKYEVSAEHKLPQLHQIEMHWFSLDEMIREDHLVRIVVKYVDSLDLTELYRQIKSTTGNVGRNAIDPQILFSLWLFADKLQTAHANPKCALDAINCQIDLLR